jgi:prophage regulatory protein
MSGMKPFYLELEKVAEAVSLSIGTVQKLIREGNFPEPRALSGRRVGWLVREVEEWAEARPVSNLPPPPDSGKRRPVTRTEEQQSPQASSTAA